MSFYKTFSDFKKNTNILNKKIVFTNGCFDILHIGHIRYLEASKRLGDVLIIGLNSDISVKKLKGNSRPINNEVNRSEMLLALKSVDYVILFGEDTPFELLSKLKPNILTKGGDYEASQVVGYDIVKKSGGEVIILPFENGFSTTNLIKKISSN